LRDIFWPYLFERTTMYPIFNLKEQTKTNNDNDSNNNNKRKREYRPVFPMKRRVGDKVEALWIDDGIFYNAVISKVRDGYDVVFDDDYYWANDLLPSQVQDRNSDDLAGSILPPTREVTSQKTRPEIEVTYISDSVNEKEKKRSAVTDIYALYSRIPEGSGIKLIPAKNDKRELFCSFCSTPVTAISSSITSHLNTQKHAKKKESFNKV
jgi:hypothetical protein